MEVEAPWATRSASVVRGAVAAVADADDQRHPADDSVALGDQVETAIAGRGGGQALDIRDGAGKARNEGGRVVAGDREIAFLDRHFHRSLGHADEARDHRRLGDDALEDIVMVRQCGQPALDPG